MKDQRGAVLIWILPALVVLFGIAALVIDAGSLYVDRRRMVTAADAAALAGAQEMVLIGSEALAQPRQGYPPPTADLLAIPVSGESLPGQRGRGVHRYCRLQLKAVFCRGAGDYGVRGFRRGRGDLGISHPLRKYPAHILYSF